MTQSKRDAAAEDYLESREVLVEFPYSKKSVCEALTREQIDAFKSGFSAGRDEAIEEAYNLVWAGYKAIKIGRGGDCPIEAQDGLDLAEKIKSLKERV